MSKFTPTQAELFAERRDFHCGQGAAVLAGFALSAAEQLISCISEIEHEAPFRHLTTPGGYRMSVAMTNCGSLGWVSDRSGYRYDPIDPQTGRPWPAMPAVFRELASAAAARLGYRHFAPDACLINQYVAGARLTLHQDRDETDLSQPIVSVSLGLPATFLFGGLQRSVPTQKLPLRHGDVVVWGGPSRLVFHGVKPLAEGLHPALGARRINLTFRRSR
jgi:alkylated DNA repair protein (DNA oxidative demethylase)